MANTLRIATGGLWGPPVDITPPGTILAPEETYLATVQNRIREHYTKWCSRIQYRVLSQSASVVDDLYHEASLSDRQWFEPITVPVVLDYNPKPKHVLEVFGIDEQRDLIIHFAEPVLLDVNLAREFSTDDPTAWRVEFFVSGGDIFAYSGVIYQIVEGESYRYWGNTNFPLYLSMTAMRQRAASTTSREPVLGDYTSCGPWMGSNPIE